MPFKSVYITIPFKWCLEISLWPLENSESSLQKLPKGSGCDKQGTKNCLLFTSMAG